MNGTAEYLEIGFLENIGLTLYIVFGFALAGWSIYNVFTTKKGIYLFIMCIAVILILLYPTAYDALTPSYY